MKEKKCKSEKEKMSFSEWVEKNRKKIVIALIVILVLLVIEFTTHIISRSLLQVKHNIFKTIGLESKVGNTIGNIQSYGYVAEDNKNIYYMGMTSNGKYFSIYKLKKNDLTSDPQSLYEDVCDITGINVIDEYIFFVTLDKEEDSDEVDNKIHRMRKDGSEHTIINDNDFNDKCFQIFAVKKRIYYIGSDECIWYMDFNGNHKTKVNDDSSGFVGITDKYILYNIYKDEAQTEISTYIMDLDGKDAREITGEQLNSVNIVDDYIYYLTSDKYIHRVKIDGTEDEMLSKESAYLFNVTKNGIFFINYYYLDDEVAGIAIYRMDLDGSNEKQITRLSNTTTTLGVLDDWIYYMDSYTDQIRIEMISFDGKQKINLYTLDYSNYYYTDTTTSSTDDSITNTTTENVVNETITSEDTENVNLTNETDISTVQ